MSELYNQSFCTTMDLLTRNMGLALSIVQRGPHPASNAKAAQKIATQFARLFENVSESYAQVSETSSHMVYSIPSKEENQEEEEEDNIIDNAIKRAMDIDVSDDESSIAGGVAFRKKQEDSDSDSSDVDMPSFGNESDEEDTSVDLDAMLPGQRENYLKTKKMQDGLRQAAFHDTEETRAQKDALGIK